MKNGIKKKEECSGEPLINKHPTTFGGHMEDYTSIHDGKRIPHSIRWVPVSESFKKT